MPAKKKTAVSRVAKKAAPLKKAIVKKTVLKSPASSMSITKPTAKSEAVVKKTTVQPKAKTVTKRVKSAPKSLALKGEKRILTHAAWKREMMKKRLKKSS